LRVQPETPGDAIGDFERRRHVAATAAQ
jgi:hypothetical protein